MSYIIDKEVLAQYISCKYYQEKEKLISEVCLHNTLFFLFIEISAKTIFINEEYLFDAKFCMHQLGAIELDIKDKIKSIIEYPLNKEQCKEVFNVYDNITIAKECESYLDEIFKCNDFRLIDILQSMKIWKESDFNQVLDKSTIINYEMEELKRK